MTTAHPFAEASAPGTLPDARGGQETARLAALHRLNLLDTPDSPNFDRVTRLTATALNVPIVLVSLVDAKRQWFKSRVGLDAAETPRAISFCAHAVIDRSPLVVVDATLDIRFAGNPMVTGAPHVRAYAGIPLYTADGHAIGALCAIDRRPRVFTPAEMNTLRDAARAIEACIAADVTTPQAPAAAAADSEAVFHDAFLDAAVGLGHMDLDGRLLRGNPVLCRMLGYRADEIPAMSFADITHPEDIAASQALLDQFTDGAIETRRIDKRYVRKDGTTLWGILSLTLKKTSSGKPHYLLATVEDITARKQAELDVASLRDALQADVEQETREAGDIVHALRSHIRRRPQLQETAHQIERRLRAVPGAPTAYVSYWNRQLRCEFVNDAYCARFNCSPDHMVGVALQETVGGALSELGSYARLALEGHEQRVGHPIELRSGQALEDIHLVPERSGAAGIQGFFLIFAGRRPQLHLDSVAG